MVIFLVVLIIMLLFLLLIRFLCQHLKIVLIVLGVMVILKLVPLLVSMPTNYVAKYMLKKLNGSLAYYEYATKDIEPEFSLMLRKLVW